MKLYIFNPENDLALADGGANYSPPPAALRIAQDLASLPLWFAGKDDAVALANEENHSFREKVAQCFEVATGYDKNIRPMITGIVPWGWSKQLLRRMRAAGFDDTILPSDDDIAAIRELSNRKSSIRLLRALAERGIDTPPMPLYFTDSDSACAFVSSVPRCVVKAPWSGSGKGIMWGIGHVEEPMRHFCNGIVRRQGGVVCEYFLEKEVEFAMEFFSGDGGISFAGYSLFTSSKGAYSGNVLAQDCEIERFISSYIPLDNIRAVREALCEELQMLVKDCGYKGYLGVDMMIYKDAGRVRLNPCMELNLRMNMGMVSRIFCDRYMKKGATGRFFVTFYRNEGEAFAKHKALTEKYPLVIDNDRVVSGYMELSLINEHNRYAAYVVVGDSPVEELYI